MYLGNGCGRNWIGWLALVISVALGFLIGSLAPYQFQQARASGCAGPRRSPHRRRCRACDYVPPGACLRQVLLRLCLPGDGAVQEIAYHAPIPKVRPRQKIAFMVVRGAFFVIFLVLAFVFSASLLAWFGINDFFSLALTAGSVVFLIVLLVSLVFYRPFCRLRLPVRSRPLPRCSKEPLPDRPHRCLHRMREV